MDNPQKAVVALLSFAVGAGIPAVTMMLGMPWMPKWGGRVLLVVAMLALIAAGIINWTAAQQ